MGRGGRNFIGTFFGLFAANKKRAVALKKEKREADSLFTSYKEKLFLFRSAYRAGIGTSTAFDAGFRVDYIFAVALCDSAYRARACACAASDAFVIDFISHFFHLTVLFFIIITRKMYFASGFMQKYQLKARGESSCKFYKIIV